MSNPFDRLDKEIKRDITEYENSSVAKELIRQGRAIIIGRKPIPSNEISWARGSWIITQIRMEDMYPLVSLPSDIINSADIKTVCDYLWQFHHLEQKELTDEHIQRRMFYSGAILGRSNETAGGDWNVDMSGQERRGLFLRAPRVGSLHLRNVEGDYIGWGLGRNWDGENRDGKDRYVCFEDVTGRYIGANIARPGSTVDTLIFIDTCGEAIGATARSGKMIAGYQAESKDSARDDPDATHRSKDFGMVEGNDTGVENAVFIRVEGDAIAEGIYARNTIFHDVATSAYPPRISWPDATPVTAYIRADPSADPDEGKPEAILYDGSTGIEVSPQAARTVRSLTDEEYQLIASLGEDNDAPPPDKDEVEDVTSRLAEGVDTDE